MHIPDGFLSLPVSVASAAVSLGMISLAVKRASRTLEDRAVPLLGVTGAFIFAAQMLNFPVWGGTSGHFMGAALAAILLGPLQSCLIMALVLIIQCLVHADGGLSALGANVLNMGVIGAFSAYGAFRLLRRILPATRFGFLAATAAASWLSIVVASAACAVELAISGTIPLVVTLPAMAGFHALIGIGEAIITCGVLATVLSVRPDLVPSAPIIPPLGADPLEAMP